MTECSSDSLGLLFMSSDAGKQDSEPFPDSSAPDANTEC